MFTVKKQFATTYSMIYRIQRKQEKTVKRSKKINGTHAHIDFSCGESDFTFQSTHNPTSTHILLRIEQ